MEEYRITKISGVRRESSAKLKDIFTGWKEGGEKFLFVSPHDDDAVLGSALMMQKAINDGVDVYISIVTDGSMGYCSEAEKDTIAQIRREETYRCYEELGVPGDNISWLGFPDCRINLYRGRRQAVENDPSIISGFTGIQNAFTSLIREIKPTRCFLPTIADLHPDHQIVYEEFMISMFHANGTIWPELGEPIKSVPDVYEMGVYCDFPQQPDIQIATSDEHLDKKVDAINKFASQTQIGSLIEIVKRNGAFEYFRSIGFNLYSPSKYRILFE